MPHDSTHNSPNDALRIGLIGLDTSHVAAFARLLNADDDPHRVAGARIVAAYPGGTRGWDLSWSRVEGFTKQMRDDYGVAILDTPEAVAERCDLVFITAVDGRAHRGLFERVVGYGRPVFVDKPFAHSVADAQAMVDAARQRGVALMSCSSLRYAEALTAALDDAALGPVEGVDVWGPMELIDALPGLLWYGCHGIEMVVRVMGPGCCAVRAVSNDHADVLSMAWADGRIATYRGLRRGHAKFGATLHREKGFQSVDVASGSKPYYATMLEAILRTLPKGASDVPASEMLEVVRLMEAGNAARRTGERVSLEPPVEVCDDA